MREEMLHQFRIGDTQVCERGNRISGRTTRGWACAIGGLGHFIGTRQAPVPALLALGFGLIALPSRYKRSVLVYPDRIALTLTRRALHLMQPSLDFLCDFFMRKLGISKSCILLRAVDAMVLLKFMCTVI
jgi:hypothetical protein